MHAAAPDGELITAVRDGDTQAYGELFERHQDAAARLARQLVPGPDADDLVSEAFIRVMATLQQGKGPDEFFRAYLLSSIRRLHIDRIRQGQRVRTTDDESELDRAVEFVDPAEMRFEQGAAADAFASLPERWQLVLWHLDVEGQRPAEVAPLLGMSPNGVSALAYRAREGLRQAYLQSHLAPAVRDECRTAIGLLGAYVRDGLARRDGRKVETHLDDCRSCSGLYLELREVNGNLAGLLGPALMGSLFAGYALSGAGATVGAVGFKIVAAQAAKAVVEPVKSVGSAISGAGAQGIVAAAVVTSVAAAGTIAVVTDFNSAEPASAAVAPRETIASPQRPPADPAAVTSPGSKPSATPTSAGPTAAAPSPTATPRATPPGSPAPTSPTPTKQPAPTTPGSTAPSAPEASAPAPAPVAEAPVMPTDYGVTAPTISDDDTLLQRRFTFGITAANAGRATDQTVTVTMQFTQAVQFRGVVSGGWDCGSATRNQQLSTLTCSTALPAGQGTTFVVKAKGLRPSGTILVTATDDPRTDNNASSFRSALYGSAG